MSDNGIGEPRNRPSDLSQMMTNRKSDSNSLNAMNTIPVKLQLPVRGGRAKKSKLTQQEYDKLMKMFGNFNQLINPAY